MNYLITGGTGFLGGHVAKLLAENGDKVFAYDNNPDEARIDKLVDTEYRSNVYTIAGDITDYDATLKACKDHEIEKIIHTAGILDSKNPVITTRVNCDGTINVLEAARIIGVKRLVAVSSVAVFGALADYKEGYIPNDAPHMPTTLYGATKSFNERCIVHYYNTYSLDAMAVRFTHIFGADRIRGIGAIYDAELFIKPARGERGEVPQGEASHNWIYVKDAARALVIASKAAKTKSRAFTAGGDVRTVAEVADYVRTLIPGADITLLPGKSELPDKFDTTQTREDLGFVPQWTIETAIKNLIDEVNTR